MNTCDTCQWWTREIDYKHVCKNEKVIDGSVGESMDEASNEAHVSAHDEADFFTGPKFGCIHWEPK